MMYSDKIHVAGTYNSSSDSYKTNVPLAQSPLKVLSFVVCDEIGIVYPGPESWDALFFC